MTTPPDLPVTTYPEVGASAGKRLPPGYSHLRMQRSLGYGRQVFQSAAERLFGWEMHRRAGLNPQASTDRVDVGSTVALTLGRPPLGLVARCVVVYVVAEPDTQGFAYGTLAGHPERGEERFVVRILDTDEVVAEIVAFSRPARLLTRLVGPATRLAQLALTRRYLRALAD